MNTWFEKEWAGVSQTFQVIRTVKRRLRKVVEQDGAGNPIRSATEKTREKSVKQPGKATPSKKGTGKKQTRKQVIFVEETSQQVLYGLTNLTPAEASPETIATFLRNHWAIENRLHWRRDVTFREDHSSVRVAGRPEALAALNNVVLALLDWLGEHTIPEHMRIFSVFPHLALELLLGKLTFE